MAPMVWQIAVTVRLPPNGSKSGVGSSQEFPLTSPTIPPLMTVPAVPVSVTWHVDAEGTFRAIPPSLISPSRAEPMAVEGARLL